MATDREVRVCSPVITIEKDRSESVSVSPRIGPFTMTVLCRRGKGMMISFHPLHLVDLLKIFDLPLRIHLLPECYPVGYQL